MPQRRRQADRHWGRVRTGVVVVLVLAGFLAVSWWAVGRYRQLVCASRPIGGGCFSYGQSGPMMMALQVAATIGLTVALLIVAGALWGAGLGVRRLFRRSHRVKVSRHRASRVAAPH